MHTNSIIALITWVQYNDFHSLWESHRHTPQLIYVVGESHHIYIGQIGGNKNETKGFPMRYQRQYLKFAKAMFGLDFSQGQRAYAGLISYSEPVGCPMVLAAEAQVQKQCVEQVGLANVLFTPKVLVPGYSFDHDGNAPAFLLTPSVQKAA